MDYRKTGRLIAAVRGEKGLTQRELAKALHISDTTVSKWERGIGFPDVSIIEPLADALGLTVAELFRGERSAEGPSPECEGLLSEAMRVSRAEMAWRKRKYLLCAVALVAVVAIAALCIVLFQDMPLLHGTYQSDIMATRGHAVTLTCDRREMTFVEYIDSREVDRGVFFDNGDGTYTFLGTFPGGGQRRFLAEMRRDNSFAVLIPGVMGDAPIKVSNVSDIPGYLGGYTYEENLASYGDNAQYRAMLEP